LGRHVHAGEAHLEIGEGDARRYAADERDNTFLHFLVLSSVQAEAVAIHLPCGHADILP